MWTEVPIPEESIGSRRSLFDYDSEEPLDIEEADPIDKDGISVYDISYNAARKRRYSAYLVEPQGEGPFAGVIFVHPSPGSRDTFLDEAVEIARKGAISLVIDAPWTEKKAEAWGKSLSEPGAAVSEHIRTVIGLRRGIDLLTTRSGLDANRIGYVGHSFGALIGGVLSGVERRVKAYILMAGTGSFTDVAVANMPSLKGERLERYCRTLMVIDPVHYVSCAAPSALLFQFGLEDTFFTRKDSLGFFRNASEPKSMMWYNAGHYLNDKARRDRDEWLSDQLSLGRQIL